MISKSSLQPGAELTDRTAAQRAAGHFQLTVTRLAHPAGMSACSFLSREQGFGRTRHSLASQDTRLSPGRPGFKSQWRNITATKARPNVSSTSECVSRVKAFSQKRHEACRIGPFWRQAQGLAWTICLIAVVRRPFPPPGTCELVWTGGGDVVVALAAALHLIEAWLWACRNRGSSLILPGHAPVE